MNRLFIATVALAIGTAAANAQSTNIDQARNAIRQANIALCQFATPETSCG